MSKKLFFVTYADENYKAQQERLYNEAVESKQFHCILPFTREMMMKTNFYEKNKALLDEAPIGQDGRVKPSFFAWKPWVILSALERMDFGDVLLYIDCGDTLNETETLEKFLFEKTQNIDIILTDGAFPNKQYTRRDCFVLCGANSEKYYDAIQVEAGIIVVKKTAQSLSIINDWLKYACDRRIISDDANTCDLENFPEFKEHRWDQSILSILKIKNQIYSSNEMRRFVYCNRRD